MSSSFDMSMKQEVEKMRQDLKEEACEGGGGGGRGAGAGDDDGGGGGGDGDGSDGWGREDRLKKQEALVRHGLQERSRKLDTQAREVCVCVNVWGIYRYICIYIYCMCVWVGVCV